MPKCFNCESELIWGADFDNEDYGIETEGIVSSYSCPECGAQYSVFVPFEKPKK